jgi:hypothetical protein
MSDVTFSEAVAKLPHCGSARAAAAGYCVNASALYAASRENAFGRNSEYYTLGYIPYEAGGTMVSDTLLNYHADWAVSQAAAALGFADDAAILLARANNFTKQLDPARGFMVPRLRNGSFVADFDEFAWGPGPGYTEAGPWQYRVEVPYNPQALKAALAAIGLDGCDIVQQANTIASTYHAGGYGGVIHEQAEMAANCWGQWELNNQPVWALLWMFIASQNSTSTACAGSPTCSSALASARRAISLSGSLATLARSNTTACAGAPMAWLAKPPSKLAEASVGASLSAMRCPTAVTSKSRMVEKFKSRIAGIRNSDVNRRSSEESGKATKAKGGPGGQGRR